MAVFWQQPPANLAPSPGQRQLRSETIYYVFRYSLRPQATAEYKQWLTDQAGRTYVGTFCDVMGCDRYDYETRWELDGNGSVTIWPLDAETELRLQDRLPFVEDGQVSVMKALNGIAPRAN